MGWLIAAGIIALPVAEIMVWVRLAEVIGGWSTVGLTILSFLGGMALLRRQGLRLMLEARARMDRGEMPLEAGFDGLCLALAGLLLVIPGFISDAAALLLLLPPVRGLIRNQLAGRIVTTATSADPTIIDGDFTVVSEEEPPSKRLEP